MEFTIASEDDVVSLVEYLKGSLIEYSTNGETDITDQEYNRIRKIIIGMPNIQDLVPDFLRNYRNLSEYWEFIKGYLGSYAERRMYLAEVLNPIIERLEDEGDFSFGNHYEKLELLGSGGFGEVFRYKNKLLGMDFAVKVLSPLFSKGGEGHLERFFREARILFKLNHPNIIKVHDVGMHGRNPYIKMELFEGKDLNKVLREHGNLSKEKALVLIEEIGHALDYAHNEIQVVHRDLRPSNIMVARPNQFRIIDFGLGVFLENDLVSRITKTGVHIAGGHYTAPELLENPSMLDVRSDIYSVGAIWFTVLTGRPPAGSKIREDLLDLEEVNEEYAELIFRCLEGLENRYQNINELLNDINHLRQNILD